MIEVEIPNDLAQMVHQGLKIQQDFIEKDGKHYVSFKPLPTTSAKITQARRILYQYLSDNISHELAIWKIITDTAYSHISETKYGEVYGCVDLSVIINNNLLQFRIFDNKSIENFYDGQWLSITTNRDIVDEFWLLRTENKL